MIAFVISVIYLTALNGVVGNPFLPYVSFEKIKDIPSPWIRQQPASPDHVLHLRIGLKQQNVDEFLTKVTDMSTPGHTSYGKHMDQEEINTMLSPKSESAILVLQWLKSLSIVGLHDNQWVTADATVAQTQDLLQTQFNVYHNPTSNNVVVRTPSYSLPSILLDHVDLIQPTTMFGMESITPSVKKQDIGSTKIARTPFRNDCKNISSIRQKYRTSHFDPSSTPSRIGIASFRDMGRPNNPNNTDLQSFFAKFRPECSGASYSTVLVNGGDNDQSAPGIEANLDVQVISGLVCPNPITFYSVGGAPPFKPDFATPDNWNEPYLEFLVYLLAQKQIPHVISISFADNEQTVPLDYATRVCNLFAQLGSRGTSVVVSSGDHGVNQGKSNDGTNRDQFNPSFPSSCPFVTSVGGTDYSFPEQGVGLSGGGFSNYFSRPSYQASTVDKFIHGLGGQYDGLFNRTGRGIPDVAAHSNGLQIFAHGFSLCVGGTSESAPIFAAIISMINGDRQAKGRRPLGFLNPWLYASGTHGLFDITRGSNPGDGRLGFECGVGWDPVTGLGTPDLEKMLAAQP